MRFLIPFAIVLMVVTGCSDRACTTPASATVKAQRFGWVIAVKPEKVERYKELHAHAWPGVQRMISDCHIRNYSIYMRELEPGKWYLFSFLEYTGTDFAADMKRMAADEETQRWWAETDPCQTPIPLAKPGEKWSTMEEVYRQD